MSIRVIGLNHRTATVDVREQMAFSTEGAATGLMMFHNRFPQCEVVMLSTCNRLELYIASDGAEPTDDQVVRFLAEARDLPINAFAHCLYHYEGEQAVRHLFRVAAGLDSMVVGEYQIVGQLKQAYAAASEQGTTGRVINRLMHQAFAVAGRVRSETKVGERKVSVPSVAVEYARSIFDDFTQKKVLVIGAGEMAQLVCKHLRALDVRRFVVTSRTLANARALASACEGESVPYDQLDEQLADSDIVISAVRCPKVLLSADRVAAVQRKRRRRPLYLIDLAVPRNVAPEVGKIGQVYLQDIDRLGETVAANEQARLAEIESCESILDQEISQFEQWLAQRESAPMIAQMYKDANRLRDMELDWLDRSCPDLSADQRAAVSQLAERLIKKLMHPCATTLKQHAASGPSATLANSLHEMIEDHENGGRGRAPARSFAQPGNRN